jgi:hypothetical protein
MDSKKSYGYGRWYSIYCLLHALNPDDRIEVNLSKHDTPGGQFVRIDFRNIHLISSSFFNWATTGVC